MPLRDDLLDITSDEGTHFVPGQRNREWPLWVERLARIGLVEDDTMTEVVFELAKWLLWVELHGEDDREARTVELLQRYVLEKHNGCVTRLNEGKEGEVLSQVERIVEGACEMSAGSKEVFLRIRQKRQQGGYKRLIEIVPVLRRDRGEVFVSVTPEDPEEGGYKSTTYSLPLREIPLPRAIEVELVRYAQDSKMRRSRGEFPLVRFALRFLGSLWLSRGAARIHTEDLRAMVGNIHQ